MAEGTRQSQSDRQIQQQMNTGTRAYGFSTRFPPAPMISGPCSSSMPRIELEPGPPFSLHRGKERGGEGGGQREEMKKKRKKRKKKKRRRRKKKKKKKKKKREGRREGQRDSQRESLNVSVQHSETTAG